MSETMYENERVQRRQTQSRLRKKKKKLTPGKVIGRVLLVFFTTVLAIVIALAVTVGTICKGPSESARELFVTTVLESGNLKFLAHMFLSEEEIKTIVDKNSMQDINTDIDDGLIHVDPNAQDSFQYDKNGIALVQVAGRTFTGKLMIIKDPSQVFVGTTYNGSQWPEYGRTLDVICKEQNAVAGVNGGLYAADANKGGSPYGVCVSKGQIQYNNPSNWAGLYMIGMDETNILRIAKIEGMTPAQFETYVRENKIRDAVAFQEESSDKNNHFVPLVINGEPREVTGGGSGGNPRTAIGQRADGSILLLVTDGRGSEGHLGATASDLIGIMMEYGAVNAANLDGGSSTCMYYNDHYEKTSVTLYYANASWRLPTTFVVKGKEN